MSADQTKYSLAQARYLDEMDELAHFRNEFYIKEDMIYLDGNSLGLLSKRSEASLFHVLDAWKHHGIDGWTNGEYPWFYLSERLGEKLAPLVGARAHEVIVTGSTTSNLHQLISTFYEIKGKRRHILTDELAFPTDIYAIQSQLLLRGQDPESSIIKAASEDGHILNEENIIQQMSEEVALIVLPSVLYRSGQVLDIERLTKEAHSRDIKIGFDLSHSIGAIPHQLNKWGVDFAVWCHYKHLNAGPGASGGLFVHERHLGKRPGLAGWFGSKKEVQFDMNHDFITAADAGAFQMGTPHILSIAPLIGSLEMFEEAGIERIRSKSLQLTAYLMDLLDLYLGKAGFIIRNPIDDTERGGHIFLEHPEAARICKALKQHQIIPDFRAPNGLRIAPVALYNSFSDCWNAVMVLKEIMDKQEYLQFENERDVIA